MGSTRQSGDRSGSGRLASPRASVRAASVPARVAGALLAAEAIVLLGLGVLLVLRGFGSGIDDVSRAETGGVLAILGALGVAVLSLGVLRSGSAFRSPTLVVQVLCLPVAWGLMQAGEYGYGIPLIVVPLVIIGSLLAAGGFGPPEPPAQETGGRSPRGKDADSGRTRRS